MKVKQEVWKMASVAEKVYMDLMARGKDIETARYIGRYRHMQSSHLRKYIMSAGWVFPGWVGFSQWFKKEFGVYPPIEMLINLTRKSKAQREEDTSFAVYLWENRKVKGRKGYKVSVMV